MLFNTGLCRFPWPTRAHRSDEELAERANGLLARHLEDVERLRMGSGGSESPTLEPEELDRLRALGYVDEPGKRK